MQQVVEALTELDRLIVIALQVNGRASWREIAKVLDESERTVAHRGNRLIQTGAVRVVALQHERVGPGEPLVLRLRSDGSRVSEMATQLSSQRASLWVYAVTGTTNVVAEVFSPPEQLSSFLFDDMANLPGLRDYSAHPVLKYFRTIDGWHPGLSEHPVLESLAHEGDDPPIDQFGPPIELSEVDRIIVGCLERDGRMTHEEMGRAAGVSKATAWRRVEALRSTEQIAVRAVVEPALLGFPVEGILWIRTPPSSVDLVGDALAAIPQIRYAAAVGGEHQVVAQVAVPTRADLYDLLNSNPSWANSVTSVDLSLVVDVFKRSNIFLHDHVPPAG